MKIKLQYIIRSQRFPSFRALAQMLRSVCLGPSILKAYNSRVAVDYLAYAVGNIDISSGAKEYALDRNVPGAVMSYHGSETLSLQGRLHTLERANPIPFAKIDSQLCAGTDQLRKVHIFHRHLKGGQHVAFLMEIIRGNSLKEEHVGELLKNGEVTKSEFATFVNKILLEKDLKAQLSNDIPDAVHTEILMTLFQVYCKTIVGDTQERLTSLQTHDINLFVKRFIDEGQLGKAQICLQYIMDKQGLEFVLEKRDVGTIRHFLQLRCGALPKYWKRRLKASNTRISKRKRLGDNSVSCNLSNSYKPLDEKSLLKIMEFLLGETSSQGKYSSSLDATIVYSLGYLGQMQLIDKFLKKKWLVPTSEAVSDETAKPELLIAALSAYCIQNGNMAKGLEILDQFVNKFPNTHLDNVFWRRLIQLSICIGDPNENKKGEISYACWNIMKQWHQGRNISIPYDQGILLQMYDLFKSTKNGKTALDVISTCFQSFYLSPEHLLVPNEVGLLNKYQKLCIRTMALKGNYHKPLKFIKEWSINEGNRKELYDYFITHRKKYDLRQDRIRLHKKLLQKRYDDMEEEDMLLGGLW